MFYILLVLIGAFAVLAYFESRKLRKDHNLIVDVLEEKGVLEDSQTMKRYMEDHLKRKGIPSSEIPDYMQKFTEESAKRRQELITGHKIF